MRHDWRDTKPVWSLLYVLGALQTGLVGLIEVTVPPGALRTILESAVVVTTFRLMLMWRRLNLARLDLGGKRV